MVERNVLFKKMYKYIWLFLYVRICVWVRLCLCLWQWWSFKQKRPPMSPINTLSPLTPNSAEWLSNGDQTLGVCACLCALSHVLRPSRVHSYEHDRQWETERTDWRSASLWVQRNKRGPESGGSLHSRVPGAALFIKTVNPHYICVCAQEYVFMCRLCECSSETVCCIKINKYAQLKASCYLAVRPKEVILRYTDNFGQNTEL